ncbi:MAG: DUF1576 domain-containing protein [Oscillospiraceae bacterium]|nr:DUF1576 domain-containing protein [Oscillospiraceae bacterium]
MPASLDKTGRTLRRFLLVLTLFFYAYAFAMPDRMEMLSGLKTILLTPAQVTKDYFVVGNLSGTFLNMALVATACLSLLFLPGVVIKGSTVVAFILAMGFTTWGINILNIWPFFFGVFLCTLVRRQKISGAVDAAMFTTGLCPIVSEMLLRYPGAEVHAPTVQSALLALAVGMGVGFLTPALIAHSPNLHKGFNLYSAAMPAGFLGLFIMAAFYKTAGVTPPAIEATLGASRPEIAWSFFGIIFVGCIITGFILNGKSFKGYMDVLTDCGHKRDYTALFGPGLAIMNFDVYGLCILSYYTFIGGSLNGVTCGIVFCMSCFAFAGSNPGNVWPIVVGYVLASLLGVNALNSQAIMVGLCYASGLAPIAGVYGAPFGIIAGAAHYTLVTSIPALHGGFCLYNGGFTSVLIAMMLVPQLENFFKTKTERRDARRTKKREKLEAKKHG